jgi:hypothetical protein
LSIDDRPDYEENYNGPVLIFIWKRPALGSANRVSFDTVWVEVAFQSLQKLFFIPFNLLRDKINSNQWSRLDGWSRFYEATNRRISRRIYLRKKNRTIDFDKNWIYYGILGNILLQNRLKSGMLMGLDLNEANKITQLSEFKL